MNITKTLVSTAVSLSIVGAVGFAYAQSNAQSINVKGPSNLTQTQSDAALPCQPTPFNPHLAQDSKSTRSTTNSNSTDCNTTPARVQVSAPVAAPVAARMAPQSDASLPNQPAPFSPNTQPATQPAPQSVASNIQNDSSNMSSERAARADRN